VNSAAFVPGRDVVLQKEPELVQPGSGDGVDGEIRVVSENPNRIELSVETAQPALLYMSEMYYSAWRATVDGEPSEILPANVGFRAVEIPAGEHDVVVEYASGSLRLGMAISLAALLFVLAAILVPRLAPDRGRRPWLGMNS